MMPKLFIAQQGVLPVAVKLVQRNVQCNAAGQKILLVVPIHVLQSAVAQVTVILPNPGKVLSELDIKDFEY